jgi:hypothetical protein
MEDNRCKTKVWPQGEFHSHRCNFKAVKDGYCKKHHPDAVEARRKASEERWRIKWDNNPIVVAHKKIVVLESKIAELERIITALEAENRELKESKFRAEGL